MNIGMLQAIVKLEEIHAKKTTLLHVKIEQR